MTRSAIGLALIVAVGAAGETEELQCDIASLQFLNRLQLTRAQALEILPLAERGAFLRRAYEQEHDALCVRLHDALVRFKAEDLRNEGLSDEVMRDAGGTDHAAKLLGAALAARLAPLEEQAAACLTPGQCRLAVPRIEDTHPLDLLRTLRGSDFEELRDTLARALANARVAAGVRDRHDRRADRLAIRAILLEVRRLDDDEYLIRREDLLRSLVPGRERSQVAGEIHRIIAARYGEAGPLAQHLFRERMLPVLAERAGVAPFTLPPPEATGRTVTGDLAPVKEEIAALKADINLLNLMNGLNLTPAQLAAIRKAASGCATATSRVEAPGSDMHALQEVYGALRRGETPPAGAMTRLQSPTAKRGAGYMQARRRELAEAQTRGLELLLDVLTPEQGDVLLTYAPCLVPPMNLRDPVRAGQANDTEPLMLIADRLRTMPLTHDAAERCLAQAEAHHGVIPAGEREGIVNLLLRVARDAQALDDVAYAAERETLAARLAPVHRLTTLKDRLRELDGSDTVIRRHVVAFLCDPRIVPLVEDRLDRLEKGAACARPADLPKAEVCEDGKCGRP